MAKLLHYFSIEKGFDVNLLLREMGKTRTIKDGKCIFRAVEYSYFLPILASAIWAHKDIAPFKPRCIQIALRDGALVLDNSDTFIKRCNKELDKLRAKRKKPFRMYCEVTYSGPRIINRLKDGECFILWEPSANSSVMKKATAAREELIRRSGKLGSLQPDKGMTTVLITVNAIDVEHAYQLSMESLDRIRGLVNLLANRSRGMNILGSGVPHAINKMRTGPFRSIHNLDGTSASGSLWYEPYWHHSQRSIKFAGTEEKIQSDIRHWIRQINRSPLKEKVTDGLIRYCRSLDQHDLDAALVGLWGSLEALTGTQKSNYDLTVARIQRLLPDEALCRIIAQHVRLRRNAHIHAARAIDSEEVDTVLHHADWLVSGVLQFCIECGHHFYDEQELHTFMDLDLNTIKLVRHRYLLDRAIKFRAGTLARKGPT